MLVSGMPGLDHSPSKMAFADLALLYPTADFEQIAVANGYRCDQRLLQLIELLKSFPDSLQNWARRRQLSPRDLQPLLAMEALPIDLLNWLAEADVSRSYGAQLIELIVDNLLLGHSDIQPPQPFQVNKIPAWIEKLKGLRFPETYKLDQVREEKYTALPWTKDFKTRWHRQGDRSGLEVRFTMASKKDLQTKIEALQRIVDACDE